MKKLVTIAASLFLALSLISCGKKIDSSTWLSDFDDAKKAAQTEGKKIFLFFSGDDYDGVSSSLKEKIFNTEDFIKKYTEKFVLVNLDFSQEKYDNDQETSLKNIRVFNKYNASGIPYFLILSKEGYIITKLALASDVALDSIHVVFDEAADEITKFDEEIAKIYTGTKEEKLATINNFLKNTDQETVALLRPLNELYISLDKKRETPEYKSHLIAITYAKAQDYLMDNNVDMACKEFEDLSKNKALDDGDRQIALYTAGYVLAQSGSDDKQKIYDYLQKAYDIAPESEEAQQIKIALTQVKMMIDGEGDIPAQEMGPAEKPAAN